MSYYEELEGKLEDLNDTDYKITIDDIDEKSIQFCVYDAEVTEEVLNTIKEFLTYINKKGGEMTGISYYPKKYGLQESFGLYYNVDIGEDEVSEEELL